MQASARPACVSALAAAQTAHTNVFFGAGSPGSIASSEVAVGCEGWEAHDAVGGAACAARGHGALLSGAHDRPAPAAAAPVLVRGLGGGDGGGGRGADLQDGHDQAHCLHSAARSGSAKRGSLPCRPLPARGIDRLAAGRSGPIEHGRALGSNHKPRRKATGHLGRRTRGLGAARGLAGRLRWVPGVGRGPEGLARK